MTMEATSEDGRSSRQSRAGHASHHAGHHSHHEEPMSPDDVVRPLLLLGQVALDAGDYESATEAYASVLQLEENEVALYNLSNASYGLRCRGYMDALV